MPNLNGAGPYGCGGMIGRGMGPCGSGRACGPNMGRGFSRGQRFGRGQGAGMGWVSVGFGGEGPAVMRAALETRRDILRAELSRAEAMLSE